MLGVGVEVLDDERTSTPLSSRTSTMWLFAFEGVGVVGGVGRVAAG